MSQGKATKKKLLKSCLTNQETVLMAENYDVFLLATFVIV